MSHQILRHEVLPISCRWRIGVKAAIEAIARIGGHDDHRLHFSRADQAVHRYAYVQVLVRALDESPVVRRKPMQEVDHRKPTVAFGRILRREVNRDGAFVRVSEKVAAERRGGDLDRLDHPAAPEVLSRSSRGNRRRYQSETEESWYGWHHRSGDEYSATPGAARLSESAALG